MRTAVVLVNLHSANAWDGMAKTLRALGRDDDAEKAERWHQALVNQQPHT
jgi:hypothetical protein